MQFKFIPNNIYLVGGSVRDFLLKKNINDYDFVIKTSYDDFHKESNNFIIKNFNKKGFLIGKEFPPTIRAVLRNKTVIDITLMIDSDLRKDALRRDFTINSIYYHLLTNQIIDPLNGKKDFKEKKIRVTSHDSFKDDPLRMLRAIRFIGQLSGFKIDKYSYELIKKNKELIKTVAVERVRDEIEKIFMFKNRYFLIKYLQHTGLLFEIFPELKLIMNIEQKKKFHKYNVLDHSLNILKYIDENLSDLDKKIYSYLAILHDIGKAYTTHRHSEESAKIAKKIFNRLKLPKNISKLLIEIIAKHMEILQISLNNIKEKTLKKFVFKNHTIINYLINFAILESNTKKNQEKLLSLCNRLKKIVEQFENKKEFIFSSITGKDLIKFGVEKNKTFKEILEEIRFQIFRDNITEKEKILKRLNEIIRQKKIS